MAKTSEGVCNARCQAFYTKILEKENALRIKWFIKNQQRLLDNLEKDKHLLPQQLPADQEKQKVTHVRLNPLPSWRPPKSDGSINTDIMKPIEPDVRAILYEKGVESFITGNNYIRERAKVSPENRYYFPECSSWVHGWRLKDYPPVPQSKVGMKSVMQAEFFHPTVSSLQRDPEWYKVSQITNVKNFC